MTSNDARSRENATTVLTSHVQAARSGSYLPSRYALMRPRHLLGFALLQIFVLIVNAGSITSLKIASLSEPLSNTDVDKYLLQTSEIKQPDAHISRLNPDGPIRIMILGDSMTSGIEGDWTWRYRVWQWFQEQNIVVDFVGPYNGTYIATSGTPPPWPPANSSMASLPSAAGCSGGYAPDVSSTFDGNHFSVWGCFAATAKYLISDVLATYPADLLMIGLGYNDMAWYYSNASETLGSVQSLVQSARSVNPNIAFAIANVPSRPEYGQKGLASMTDEYNTYLRDVIPKWNSSESPVALVEWRENYGCRVDACPDAYDGVHPDTHGEYQIASAFTKTLVSAFGIGTSSLKIPVTMPIRAKPVPSNFEVLAGPDGNGFSAKWDKVYGNHGYDIRFRAQGDTNTTWNTTFLQKESYEQIGDGVFEVSVRTSLGINDKGDWSEVRTTGVTDSQGPQDPQDPQDSQDSQGSAEQNRVSWAVGIFLVLLTLWMSISWRLI